MVWKNRTAVAIAIVAVIATAPVAAAYAWLHAYIERQGHEEAEAAAKRTISLAETRLSRTIAALNDLHARGVVSCTRSDLEAMNETMFAVAPIKELSVVDPDGATVCSNLGIRLGERSILAPRVGNPGPHLVVEVIRLGVGDRAVRVRRFFAEGGAALAALIPAELFIPQETSDGGTFGIHARVMTTTGTIISVRGEEPADETADRLLGERTSERFGIVAVMTIPRAQAHASRSGLLLIGTLGAGAIAALALCFALMFPRRSRENPVAALERAITDQEFVPYYQPIVDITSAQVVGAEVLVRWRRSDGTMVSPANFIPLAESSGLIIEITRCLMRRVRDEVGEALRRRPDFKIGFNLTARHFADETVVADVREIFDGSPVALSQIALEVTERQPLEDLTAARRVIAALQGLGCQIAIDDVGTGHGGLSYMLKLGVDVIKIDKMFVDAIGTERYSTTIIETLVDLARNMRMEIIAEGVETFEQVTHLRDHGINVAQGFVFAPPLPGPAFLGLLESVSPIGAPSDAVPREGAWDLDRIRAKAGAAAAA